MGRLLKAPALARTDQYVPQKFKHNPSGWCTSIFGEFLVEVGSEAYVEGVGSFLLFTQSHRLVLAVL